VGESNSNEARIRCASLFGIVRFMRESGDPALLAEYQKIEDLRFEQIHRELSPRLRSNPQLRKGMSSADALATIWALTGTDLYHRLVIGLRWTPARYELWLTDLLVNTLLDAPVRANRRMPAK
jgi:hypothetical protein